MRDGNFSIFNQKEQQHHSYEDEEEDDGQGDQFSLSAPEDDTAALCFVFFIDVYVAVGPVERHVAILIDENRWW